MTRAKYATIMHDQHNERVLVQRGKQDSWHYRCKCDECWDGSGSMQKLSVERVVELPEPMTEAEYNEYLDASPHRLSNKIDEVGQEYGCTGDSL